MNNDKLKELLFNAKAATTRRIAAEMLDDRRRLVSTQSNESKAWQALEDELDKRSYLASRYQELFRSVQDLVLGELNVEGESRRSPLATIMLIYDEIEQIRAELEEEE